MMGNAASTRPVTVWAPRAKRVELVWGRELEERAELEPAGQGWYAWQGSLAEGVDYAFRLDAGPPLPDPRSRWQPHGVHGASRALDTSSFAWSAPEFRALPLERAVIYEIHIGTFSPGGTFLDAIEKLPYLKDLGVTHVEILPIAEFSGRRGWGYDGVFHYAAYSGYGGPRAFARLVDACHANGLGVILDVVYNHFGPEGNYVERYGPYLSPAATPWGAAVNLDGPDCEAVRRYFIDNALMWLREFRVDGLRLDAVDALHDRGPLHLLEELSAEVAQLEHELGRPLFLIGESDLNDPRLTRPRSEHGHGIHAQWNEEFQRAVHTAITQERAGWYADYRGLEDLVTVLQHGFAHRGRFSSFRRRRHGRAHAEVPRERLIVYLQTHDLVGNRPRGERLAHLVAPQLARLTTALLLLGPCIPMLFQGEEWHAETPFLYFTDHQDAGLGSAVLAGRQRDFVGFGWPSTATPDPQHEATFDRSRLEWDELSRPDQAAWRAWYQRLIELRASFAVLGAPARAELDEGCISLVRPSSVALFNFSERAYTYSISEPLELVHTSIAGLEVGKLLESDVLTLGAHEYALLRRGSGR